MRGLTAPAIRLRADLKRVLNVFNNNDNNNNNNSIINIIMIIVTVIFIIIIIIIINTFLCSYKVITSEAVAAQVKYSHNLGYKVLTKTF